MHFPLKQINLITAGQIKNVRNTASNVTAGVDKAVAVAFADPEYPGPSSASELFPQEIPPPVVHRWALPSARLQ